MSEKELYFQLSFGAYHLNSNNILVNISTQHKILVYYLNLSMYQASQVSKVCGGSFSENGGGLNIYGTVEVLFIDLFLNAYRFNLGYCVHLLTNFRDAAKYKCKKN